MDIPIFEELHKEGLIEAETLNHIRHAESNKPLSLQWELKTLMYVGILLLTTGLGITVYKNLDSIGHLTIITFIAIATIGCFAYCLAKAQPFTTSKAAGAGLLYDYILLLGCLLLLTLVGYLQFQYEIFGNRWGMATFIPMVILFAAAYYFDHLGVLSLAIVNLAAWAGITVTPQRLLKDNDFNDESIIYTGIALGVFLIAVGFFSMREKIKSHFSFTYKNFGTHILFIALIAAIAHFDRFYLLWLIPFAAASYLQFRDAVKERSFYFLVITTLYCYAGVSYTVMHLLFNKFDFGELALYTACLYFISTGLGLAFFLIKYNKLLKKHDSLQQN